MGGQGAGQGLETAAPPPGAPGNYPPSVHILLRLRGGPQPLPPRLLVLPQAVCWRPAA